MKFEVGKEYKTRDGRIVRVLATDAPSTRYPVIVLFMDSGGPASFTSGGAFNSEAPSNMDLIAEHREPRRLWVNFHNDTWTSYGSEAEAKSFSDDTYMKGIAVEFIEVMK